MSQETVTYFIWNNELNNDPITRTLVEGELYGTAILSVKENIPIWVTEIRYLLQNSSKEELIKAQETNDKIQKIVIEKEWHQYDWEYDAGKEVRKLVLDEVYMEKVDRNMI